MLADEVFGGEEVGDIELIARRWFRAVSMFPFPIEVAFVC